MKQSKGSEWCILKMLRGACLTAKRTLFWKGKLWPDCRDGPVPGAVRLSRDGSRQPPYSALQRDRSLRLKRNLTQVELGELLGIDRSYLSEIETGKKDPSLTVLKTIADGFHMSLSRFLSGF